MAIDYALGIRILFITGILNAVFIILVFFTCRCLAGPKITNRLFRYGWFKRLYQKHCWFWWGFVISAAVHGIVTSMMFAWPF